MLIEKKITASPRITKSTAMWLEKHFGSRGQGAEFVIDAFPSLYMAALAEMRGRFTSGELRMMVDVSNGVAMLIPSMGALVGQNLRLSIEDSFRLYPGAYEAAHAVDREEFTGKLSALTRFQLACLEIWACGFWAGEYTDEEYTQKYIGQIQ